MTRYHVITPPPARKASNSNEEYVHKKTKEPSIFRISTRERTPSASVCLIIIISRTFRMGPEQNEPSPCSSHSLISPYDYRRPAHCGTCGLRPGATSFLPSLPPSLLLLPPHRSAWARPSCRAALWLKLASRPFPSSDDYLRRSAPPPGHQRERGVLDGPRAPPEARWAAQRKKLTDPITRRSVRLSGLEGGVAHATRCWQEVEQGQEMVVKRQEEKKKDPGPRCPPESWMTHGRFRQVCSAEQRAGAFCCCCHVLVENRLAGMCGSARFASSLSASRPPGHVASTIAASPGWARNYVQKLCFLPRSLGLAERQPEKCAALRRLPLRNNWLSANPVNPAFWYSS